MTTFTTEITAQMYWEVINGPQDHSAFYRDDFTKMKANDRRKLVNSVYDDWFKSQNLKLGRDFYIDVKVPSYTPVTQTKYNMSITFHNPKTAVLFKLTHV